MNLFVVPSWYPSFTQPLGGIFVQEQVQALAALAPDMRVLVSLWGQYDGLVPVRHPWRIAKVIRWRFSQRSDTVVERQRGWEVFNPKLHWSSCVPLGGARQLVNVNRRNFRLASQRFGKIDLIHAHVSYPAGYVASLLSEEFGVPYVLTEHMGPFPFPPLLRGDRPIPEIDAAFGGAAVSIAVSPALSKRIASFGYREPVVIPNIVDERVFIPGDPEPGKIVFFTLCGISAQKGIDHLLDAIALWDPPADHYEFRIGGDGPLRKLYQAKAHTLGLDDRVHWLGAVSRADAPTLFRQCHIYVMPSRHETFGVVYAEAIACGKPVIATRCGGPEFIVNSDNGKLVDIGDVRALSQTMRDVAEHWSAYNPQAIRHDFEQRFSRGAVVRQLCALYARVAD